MKYICRACEGGDPCILDVHELAELPTTCPWRDNLSKDSFDSAKWEELPESDFFGMRGLGKTQVAENCDNCADNCEKKCEDCANNDDRCIMCDTCYDMNLFEAKNKQETPHKRGKILLKALDIINGERQDQYGNPEDSFALIADYWTTFLKSRDLIPSKGSYHALKISPKEVSEMMMLFKIARMSGQKPSLDNYLDLVGYAGIAADMIEEDKI